MKAKDTVMTRKQFSDKLHLPSATLEEIAKAQAEISFNLRTEDILKQLREFSQRGLTITEAIELLQ